MANAEEVLSERVGTGVPAIQVTINVSGLVTEEALTVIAERVEASVAAAIDEARRFRTDTAG